VGDRIDPSALVVGHADEVRRRLELSVAALQRMVDGGWFDDHEDTIGMEVELDLVDPLGRPRLINDAVLARLGRADMQHELGQFNVELNLAPRRLQGRVLHDSERDLADVLELVHPEIVFKPVSAAVIADGEPYCGHDGIRRYLADVETHWLELTVRPVQIRAAGEAVVALGEVTGRGTAGALDRAPTTRVLKFRDRLVIHAQVFSDERLARAALGL